MKLSRKDKCRLLIEIRAGRLPVEVLRQGRIYFFMEEQPGQFSMDGQFYNQQEYDRFCKRIANANNYMGPWQSFRMPDTIITFIQTDGCEPIQE